MQIDSVQYNTKPGKDEIGGIKLRLARLDAVKDLPVKDIADALIHGKTVQPGVCPKPSDRQNGGTRAADFREQQLFFIDVDNDADGIPNETPEHAAEILRKHGVNPCFGYHTFHSGRDGAERFRVVIALDSVVTDRHQRDVIDTALSALIPQADHGTHNADRVYYGTTRDGLIDALTDFDATNSRDAVYSMAQTITPTLPKPEPRQHDFGDSVTGDSDIGTPIITGERHRTLRDYALRVLTARGETDTAKSLYLRRVGDCEEPHDRDDVARIWADCVNYYHTAIETRPDYTPPKFDGSALNWDGTLKDDSALITDDWTDVGQGQIFSCRYYDNLRWNPSFGWLQYRGGVWKSDDSAARKLAQAMTDAQLRQVRAQLRKARNAVDKSGETSAKSAEVLTAEQLQKTVKSRRADNKIAATLRCAAPYMAIRADELDAQPLMINTPGGIVDLTTGDIRPTRPDDYCTMATAVAPSDDGADIWGTFLRKLTCGDDELREYLQICAGMQIIGTVYTESLIIATGTGGNGKSTYYNTLCAVLGDYAGTIAPDVLCTPRSHAVVVNHPELVNLRGKRLVVASELDDSTRMDTAALKRLCSTDRIAVNPKYRQPFDFVPSHTLVLYTNHLPRVTTLDRGTWDRIAVVPFRAKFRGESDEIPNYAQYLTKHAGGAVLKWMIDGARKYHAAGHLIHAPKAVADAKAEYRDANDWLTNFLTARCDIGDPKVWTSAQCIYVDYIDFCRESGEFVKHNSDFAQALISAGFERHKTKSGIVFRGIRLKYPKQI